jgi:hypothetical protein
MYTYVYPGLVPVCLLLMFFFIMLINLLFAIESFVIIQPAGRVSTETEIDSSGGHRIIYRYV